MNNAPAAPEVHDLALAVATDAQLLRAFASLTHRMHADGTLVGGRDLRAQRELVETEILARMGGTR